MDGAQVTVVPGWLAAVIALWISAAIGAWGLIFARLWEGKSPLPCEPRRPVPWKAVHVLLILVIYFLSIIAVPGVFLQFVPPEVREAAASAAGVENSHPVEQLLKNGPPAVLAVCFLVAVVVAPVTEEFLFRLVLQGWLEGLDGRWRRRLPALRQWLPRGLLAIVPVAIFFALLHFRTGGKAPPWQYSLAVIAGNGLAQILTVTFAASILRYRTGATAYDLGFVPSKLAADVKTGAVAYFALIIPIYAVQVLVMTLLPKNIAPDPVALFLLAMVLGWLYFRTHRLVPAMVVHAMLNATSLALAYALSK